MRKLALALPFALAPVPAFASPGVGDPVYGATVEKGLTEFETRYGRLTGGAADGEDGMVFEAEHGFSQNLSVAALVETSREPATSRKVEAFALEGIYALGRIKPLALDTALYVEYKHSLRAEPDAVEVKGLFEHKAGAFDGRLNLIMEKPLDARQPVELGYAASADWAVIGDEVRLGLASFGDLGTFGHFAGREEYYLGPEMKLELEHIGPGELEIETGWLKAFDAARDKTDGQARLLVSYEAHF